MAREALQEKLEDKASLSCWSRWKRLGSGQDLAITRLYYHVMLKGNLHVGQATKDLKLISDRENSG